MKRNHLLALLLLASGGLLHAEADSALENQMKILARGTRQLSQQVSDPANQQSTITLIENLKKAALDAKILDPRKTSEIPEERGRSSSLTSGLNWMSSRTPSIRSRKP